MGAGVKPWRLVLKALALFCVFDLIYGAASPPLGRFSLYNLLFSGRERFPFGENLSLSHNLSLFDIDAMFASHEVEAVPESADEYRLFIVGDSSVWGILLRPGETLAGQLNVLDLRVCGRPLRAYNLGYPTISLTKDLMILDRAMRDDPDMILWLTTLEAFPRDKQLSSPIVANNPRRLRDLAVRLAGKIDASPATLETGPLDFSALIRERRNLADLARLQLLGVLWSATGIDQLYPSDYPPAQTDLEADPSFHGRQPPRFQAGELSFDLLDGGRALMDRTPSILVNEPILVSAGRNSDVRYNFFYPRWAYDQYRQFLKDGTGVRRWEYLDLWDAVPASEFTNSAIHLTPRGEGLLAERIGAVLESSCR